MDSIREVIDKMKELSKQHNYGEPITFRADTTPWKKWCLTHEEWEWPTVLNAWEIALERLPAFGPADEQEETDCDWDLQKDQSQDSGFAGQILLQGLDKFNAK